jgi:transposase
MLRWIAIFGGLLLMMGQHSRSESLFYYFRLEDQVPENHLLRLIDRHVSFDFVREQLRDSYSGTGRPSIDPELLLRILLEQLLSRCIRNYHRRAECPAPFRYIPSAEPV